MPRRRRLCLLAPLAGVLAAVASWPPRAAPPPGAQSPPAFVVANRRLAARPAAAPPPRVRRGAAATEVEGAAGAPTAVKDAPPVEDAPRKKWWEKSAEGLIDKYKAEEATDSIQKLRRQMTNEEAAFDAEIDEIVLAGKRALLKLRMQKAAELDGFKHHLMRKIRKQIARALTLRREREIARGITREQSRRMKRRRRLELQMKYEKAYGKESDLPKSRKWRRRMGRIV